MENLINLVTQWGIDRKIIGNGKLETQWLKLISEFGEMTDSLAKAKSPIDDIGDQMVVMIMMAGIAGKTPQFKTAANTCKPDDLDIMTLAGMLCTTYGSLRYYGNQTVNRYCDALNQLGGIATKSNKTLYSNLTLYNCLDHSYQQIKDRKGFLNEHGVFVKEE